MYNTSTESTGHTWNECRTKGEHVPYIQFLVQHFFTVPIYSQAVADAPAPYERSTEHSTKLRASYTSAICRPLAAGVFLSYCGSHYPLTSGARWGRKGQVGFSGVLLCCTNKLFCTVLYVAAKVACTTRTPWNTQVRDGVQARVCLATNK